MGSRGSKKSDQVQVLALILEKKRKRNPSKGRKIKIYKNKKERGRRNQLTMKGGLQFGL